MRLLLQYRSTRVETFTYALWSYTRTDVFTYYYVGTRLCSIHPFDFGAVKFRRTCRYKLWRSIIIYFNIRGSGARKTWLPTGFCYRDGGVCFDRTRLEQCSGDDKNWNPASDCFDRETFITVSRHREMNFFEQIKPAANLKTRVNPGYYDVNTVGKWVMRAAYVIILNIRFSYRKRFLRCTVPTTYITRFQRCTRPTIRLLFVFLVNSDNGIRHIDVLQKSRKQFCYAERWLCVFFFHSTKTTIKNW